MEHLTLESFKEKVFDYEAGSEWKFKGDRPAIIDFYANWCGPCKMVAPVLDELESDFDGAIAIYKVDTEQEQQLAEMFKIRSIPSILFIPVDAPPQMANGAIPKEGFVEIIGDVFGLSPE